jgi:hypothetical protein
MNKLTIELIKCFKIKKLLKLPEVQLLEVNKLDNQK